jgi:cyclomaltodextrinase
LDPGSVGEAIFHGLFHNIESLPAKATASLPGRVASSGAFLYHDMKIFLSDHSHHRRVRSEENELPLKRVGRGTFRVVSFVALLMGMTSAARSQQPSFVPSWVKDAVFYQIFPDRFANGDPTNDPPGSESWGGVPTSRNTFGGDLQGIIDHLDYLSRLGINAVYLNPIFESGSNHKYNTTDYLKIDPHFGDDAIFRKLIDSCHSRGIRVILDAVFNHTGVDFFAFVDLKKNGERSRYSGWYNVYGYPLGPAKKPNYECWRNHGSLPKLMTGNPEVRRYLFDVTRHWMEQGIDGWRLDAADEIPHEFWIDWRTFVKSIDPDAYIVGEIWKDGSAWLKGDQFDGVTNYHFRSACVDFFATRKLPASEFARGLEKQHASYGSEVNPGLMNLLGSHDTERFLTLCKGDTSAVKLAVLFQMTFTGTPILYYGDEVGMKGGADPGCRGTMVWEPERQDSGLLETYRSLIAMRKAHPVFRSGSYDSLLTDDRAGIHAFSRHDRAGTAIIVLNNSGTSQTVKVPLRQRDGIQHLQQVWPESGETVIRGSSLALTLPAHTGTVHTGGEER